MSDNMHIIETNEQTHYCNTVRINSSTEEVFMDFGVNRPSKKGCSVELNQRVAMNYFTAKRLVLNLGNHLRMFEEKYGDIDIGSQNE